MYSLTVAVGPTMWSLLFTSEENAKRQEACLKTAVDTDSFGAVTDDFGQILQVRPKSLHGWMLENLDETKLAHCERMLHQARTQGTAQRMAESDPMLRMGTNMRGPGIISAVPGNGR